MRKFYETALLEGEGLGTAYEYYIKRRLLVRLFAEYGFPETICVFGIPEKYGASMDFCLLAEEVKAVRVTVYDEREQAVKKCEDVIGKMKESGIFPNVPVLLAHKAEMDLKEEKYDFIVNCDVFQRFEEAKTLSMIKEAAANSSFSVFFLPNGHNVSHVVSPNRKAVAPKAFLEKTRELVDVLEWGYVDMPPFPSGSQMSKQKRDSVKIGTFSIFVFLVLEFWSIFELLLPIFLKKKFAHAFYLVVRKKI